MSLVENLARRQHRAIDLLHDIQGLKKRGYPKLKPSEHLTDHFGLVSDFLSECYRARFSGYEQKVFRLFLSPCGAKNHPNPL